MIRGKFLVLLLLATTLTTSGQALKGRFIFGILPDNSWDLHLKRDNTYKYIHWSGFSGSATLDSGKYSITNGVLTFTSNTSNNKNSFSEKRYYIERIKLKRHQYIDNFRTNEKNTLCGKKIIALKLAQNDSIRIFYDIAYDTIVQKKLSPDSSLTSWINNKILPQYGYKPTDLDSTYRTDLYSSKTLEVKAVHNSSDMFEIFYLADRQIYYTPYQRDLKYELSVLKLLQKRGFIKAKEKVGLKKSIELLIKEITEK